MMLIGTEFTTASYPLMRAVCATPRQSSAERVVHLRRSLRGRPGGGGDGGLDIDSRLDISSRLEGSSDYAILNSRGASGYAGAEAVVCLGRGPEGEKAGDAEEDEDESHGLRSGGDRRKRGTEQNRTRPPLLEEPPLEKSSDIGAGLRPILYLVLCFISKLKFLNQSWVYISEYIPRSGEEKCENLFFVQCTFHPHGVLEITVAC